MSPSGNVCVVGGATRDRYLATAEELARRGGRLIFGGRRSIILTDVADRL